MSSGYFFSRAYTTVSRMDRGKEFARLVAIELATEGKRRGVTQRELALAAGVGAVQFSYYTAGTRGDMTVATLMRAAERLGIDPDVIVARAYALLPQDAYRDTAARKGTAPKEPSD